MNVLEDLSETEGRLNPRSNRLGKYSAKVPLVCWLFLFATVGFTFYRALQSFLSTGRAWPLIFILVIFLLLGNSYLKMRQCRVCDF